MSLLLTTMEAPRGLPSAPAPGEDAAPPAVGAVNLLGEGTHVLWPGRGWEDHGHGAPVPIRDTGGPGGRPGEVERVQLSPGGLECQVTAWTLLWGQVASLTEAVSHPYSGKATPLPELAVGAPRGRAEGASCRLAHGCQPKLSPLSLLSCPSSLGGRDRPPGRKPGSGRRCL